MAYPGEYRREQYLGEDGYVEGGEYNGRGYATEAGYGAPYGSEGYGVRPYGGEQYEHHKHGHHHQPEVVYVQPTGESDLGTGLSGGLRGEGYGGGYSGGYNEGYGAGYGRNQPGYAAPAAYGAGGYGNGQVERLEEELRVERRRAHEAEAAAAAATAYAVHERHERKEEEEELERFEPLGEQKHKHHFFGLD